MTNATDEPIRWDTVELKEFRILARRDESLVIGGLVGGRASQRGTWAPRETVTVQLPLAPDSPKLGTLQGFIVLVQSTGTDTGRYAPRFASYPTESEDLWQTDRTLILRAFNTLTVSAQR